MEFDRDRDKKVGNLLCRICKTNFKSKINHLSHEVDVYCDWIDACHQLNTKQPVDPDEEDGGQDEDEEEDDMIGGMG